MSLSTITENEWDNENIECRINNEAHVLGIQNFNLIKNDINIDFTGSLRLIDAIKIIYELQDSGFNMYKECKTVLSLSKNNNIDVNFIVNRHTECCVTPTVNINTSLTKDESYDLNHFKDHIVFMLDIWKAAMVKRWTQYFNNGL